MFETFSENPTTAGTWQQSGYIFIRCFLSIGVLNTCTFCGLSCLNGFSNWQPQLHLWIAPQENSIRAWKRCIHTQIHKYLYIQMVKL